MAAEWNFTLQEESVVFSSDGLGYGNFGNGRTH